VEHEPVGFGEDQIRGEKRDPARNRLTEQPIGFAVVLVFIGTLAQVDEGLYQAQTRYFRAFLIYWSPSGAHWKMPVFPGGYLLGTVLLANLLAAHTQLT